jgi:hypothetical protein
MDERYRFQYVDPHAQLKYLATTEKYQELIQEEIKRKLNSCNACYHSVHNLLFSRLLSKNVKIRIYKTVTLPVVLYGCENWSATLKEEHGVENILTEVGCNDRTLEKTA